MKNNKCFLFHNLKDLSDGWFHRSVRYSINLKLIKIEQLNDEIQNLSDFIQECVDNRYYH